MFVRNASLAATTTIQELIRTRRKMKLSDAMRSISGEPVRRDAYDSTAALGEDRSSPEGVYADWQIKDPRSN
jgi:hypothetical protein